MGMNYCSNCGEKVSFRIPEDDERPRHICDACHVIHYENPKIVVGCIPEWEDKILLCRRAIEPRIGKWTLPAGYLENTETLAEGARREAFEETNADVQIISPHSLFNLTFINQIYFMFRARLIDTDFGPSTESTQVELVAEKNIPWEDLAFNVIEETLALYFKDRAEGVFGFQMRDISRR